VVSIDTTKVYATGFSQPNENCWMTTWFFLFQVRWEYERQLGSRKRRQQSRRTRDLLCHSQYNDPSNGSRKTWLVRQILNYCVRTHIHSKIYLMKKYIYFTLIIAPSIFFTIIEKRAPKKIKRIWNKFGRWGHYITNFISLSEF
jgi:hypothetical protein